MHASHWDKIKSFYWKNTSELYDLCNEVGKKIVLYVFRILNTQKQEFLIISKVLGTYFKGYKVPIRRKKNRQNQSIYF